jgi:hypothetical protein
MFGMILRTQWAWTRLSVAVLSVVTFVAPAIVWRFATEQTRGAQPDLLVYGFGALGPLLSFLALIGAFLLAAQPWTIDAETQHVYPLSLPVSWSRFVAMRFGAGAIFLLLPALGLYVGSLLVLAMIEMPPLLRGYPGALAMRFLLASAVAYAATFALQYLAGRRAAVVALGIMIAIGLTSLATWALGAPDLVSTFGRFLFVWPGPLAVFSEPWTLIDV